MSWVRTADAVTDWLSERTGDDGWGGFDVGGMPDWIWLLNVMYERTDGRPIVDDADMPEAPDRYEVWRDSDGNVVVESDFGNLGKAAWAALDRRVPRPGLRRVLWREFSERYKVPMVIPGQWPGLQGALPGLWDEPLVDYFEGPDEGGLDDQSWKALLPHLTQHSAHGLDAICFAMFTNPFGDSPRYTGRLGDVLDLLNIYEHEPDAISGSPQNVWDENRTWVTYSDYDAWATRISGPPALIEDLIADNFLEAERLPDVPDP